MKKFVTSLIMAVLMGMSMTSNAAIAEKGFVMITDSPAGSRVVATMHANKNGVDSMEYFGTTMYSSNSLILVVAMDATGKVFICDIVANHPNYAEMRNIISSFRNGSLISVSKKANSRTCTDVVTSSTTGYFD